MGYWKIIIIEKEVWVEDRLEAMQRRVKEAAWRRGSEKRAKERYNRLWMESGINWNPPRRALW
jgi:hypothetical protein